MEGVWTEECHDLTNVLIGSLRLLCSEEAAGEQKEEQGYVN